jgi:hypothetical protein
VWLAIASPDASDQSWRIAISCLKPLLILDEKRSWASKRLIPSQSL